MMMKGSPPSWGLVWQEEVREGSSSRRGHQRGRKDSSIRLQVDRNVILLAMCLQALR